MRGLTALVAIMLWGAAAQAACLPKTQRCYDFSTIPAIGDQIVGQEKLPAAPDKAPPGDGKKFYNGPTFGIANTPRGAPEIGYHWSVN
jgi:hypothetical protein